MDTSYWTGFNHFCIWGTLIVHFLFHFALYSEFIFKLFGIGWYYIGTSQAVCSTAVFWLTVLLTSAILLLPIIAYRFIRLDAYPTIAERVRIVQKFNTKSRTNIFRTRPRSSMRASTRSTKRSAYAFSHEEGFAALIREGKMMPDPIVSRTIFHFWGNLFLHKIFSSLLYFVQFKDSCEIKIIKTSLSRDYKFKD